MATDCIPQVTFKFYDHLKPVVARFDQAQASTDGGAVLLKALDERLQLTDQLAGCLTDHRDPDKILHPLRDLLRQRIFGLACGYEDANDAARLAHDPLHKLAVGRDPVTGAALASQPTLSRFENGVSPWTLARMGRTLAATVIAHHRARLKGHAQRITIDLDPTDDPTHGQQAFTFFNGHYDTWCYLPLVATLTFNNEADQYLVAIVLRPGNSPATRGAHGLLRMLVRHLRRAFPGAALRVRVDGGFAGNAWLDCLEAQRVEYVVGLASNARLVQRAGRLLGEAYGLSKYSGRTEHVYGETGYAARSWSHRRRVIIKAEVVRLPERGKVNEETIHKRYVRRYRTRRIVPCHGAVTGSAAGSVCGHCKPDGARLHDCGISSVTAAAKSNLGSAAEPESYGAGSFRYSRSIEY